MKGLSLFICVACFTISAYSGNQELLEKLVGKKFIKSGNNFISEKTITYLEYMKFANALVKANGENSIPGKFVAPTKYVDKSIAENDAIVGITFKQASQFCSWFGEDIYKKMQAYKAEHPNEVLPHLIALRLPTLNELKSIEKLELSEITNVVGKGITPSKENKEYSKSEPDLTFRIVAEIK